MKINSYKNFYKSIKGSDYIKNRIVGRINAPNTKKAFPVKQLIGSLAAAAAVILTAVFGIPDTGTDKIPVGVNDTGVLTYPEMTTSFNTSKVTSISEKTDMPSGTASSQSHTTTAGALAAGEGSLKNVSSAETSEQSHSVTLADLQAGGEFEKIKLEPKKPVIKGSPLVKSDVIEFFSDRIQLDGMAQSIILTGGKSGDTVFIGVKGFGYLSLEDYTVNTEFINAPSILDGEIASINSFYKSDNKTLWGGTCLSDNGLNKVFKDYPESELVFICGGWQSAVITPDNRIFSLNSQSYIKFSDYFEIEKPFDYYNTFKTPYNVYSKKMMEDKQNFIECKIPELPTESLPSNGETYITYVTTSAYSTEKPSQKTSISVINPQQTTIIYLD